MNKIKLISGFFFLSFSLFSQTPKKESTEVIIEGINNDTLIANTKYNLRILTNEVCTDIMVTPSGAGARLVPVGKCRFQVVCKSSGNMYVSVSVKRKDKAKGLRTQQFVVIPKKK